MNIYSYIHMYTYVWNSQLHPYNIQLFFHIIILFIILNGIQIGLDWKYIPKIFKTSFRNIFMISNFIPSKKK